MDKKTVKEKVDAFEKAAVNDYDVTLTRHVPPVAA